MAKSKDKERRCETCAHFERVYVPGDGGFCIQPNGTRGPTVYDTESCGDWQPPMKKEG
jgi:hypothetical protein